MKKPPIDYSLFKKLRIARGDRFSWKSGDVEVHPPQERPNRFSWKLGDLAIHPRKKPKLDEAWFPDSTSEHPHGEPGSYHQPHKEPSIYADAAWSKDNPEHSMHSGEIHHSQKRNHVQQFAFHAKNIDKNHRDTLKSIQHYKSDGYERINNDLRKNRDLHPHDYNHVGHLDHATSFKTTHDMHVFRGVHKEALPYHTMHPGTEFTDHGYTSTSLRHGAAMGFGGGGYSKDNKAHVFKIHVPAGTKAHHFDSHNVENQHENEVVLGRGTRFRVTHHSVDHENRTHYIHATVVGQHPREVQEDPDYYHHHDPGYA
jgi:hypothetical protein